MLSALAHDTATPVLADLLEAVVVVGLDRLNKLGKSRLVLLVDVSEGKDG